jgi:hypothetical protein
MVHTTPLQTLSLRLCTVLYYNAAHIHLYRNSKVSSIVGRCVENEVSYVIANAELYKNGP